MLVLDDGRCFDYFHASYEWFRFFQRQKSSECKTILVVFL